MKKSDFIDNLYENRRLYELIVTAEDAFDVHYTIAEIIEEALRNGMLAPEIENPDRKKCVREPFYINSWESENG